MPAATILGSMVVALTAAVSAQACHDYVLVSTRGTYEKQGPSIGFTGMINTTLATLPNGIEYDTVYPASTNLTGAFVGVTDVIRYINTGLASCPQQKYALLGYSQGATVTDISLHNFTSPSSPAYNAIKGIVVIGNPGHVYGATANVDQNGTDATRNFTGPYTLNGAGEIPNVYYKDDKVLDICYQGDYVCGYNGTSAIEYAHLKYGSTPSVQKLGSDFLIRKLGNDSTSTPSNGIQGGNSTSTTSATPVAYTGAACQLLQSGYGIVIGSIIGLAMAML